MKKLFILAAIVFICCSQSLAQTRHSVVKDSIKNKLSTASMELIAPQSRLSVGYNASIFTKKFIAIKNTPYVIWEEDSEPQPVDINDVASNVNMNLQPNPATISQVRLSVEGVSGMLDCAIIDMSGRVVYNDKFSAESPKFINLGGLNKGAYFVRITNSTFFKVKKLIVR